MWPLCGGTGDSYGCHASRVRRPARRRSPSGRARRGQSVHRRWSRTRCRRRSLGRRPAECRRSSGRMDVNGLRDDESYSQRPRKSVRCWRPPLQNNITTPRSHREGTAPASVPTPSTVHQSGSPEGTGPSGRVGRGCRRADRAGRAASGTEIRSATAIWSCSPGDEGHAAPRALRGTDRENVPATTARRHSGALVEQRHTLGVAERLWFDDPRLHGHRTFLIRRQDNAPRSLPMVQMDITLNVTPSGHRVDWWQVRTVTLESGTSPSVLVLLEAAVQEACSA